MSRILCRIFGHEFAGWPAQTGFVEGSPLPYAHCARCRKEL